MPQDCGDVSCLNYRSFSLRLLIGISPCLLGSTSALAFAPFGLWLLAPACIAALHGLTLYEINKSATLFPPWRFVRIGWLFGFGLFITGCHWIYAGISKNGENSALASTSLTILFCLLLGLCYALVCVASGYVARSRKYFAFDRYCLLIFPAVWTISEWLRSYFSLGFPWLLLGDTQIPGGLFVGASPVGGVFLLSFLIALMGGLLACGLRSACMRQWNAVRLYAGVACVLLAGDAILRKIDWTEADGNPVSITLIQTHFPHASKWTPTASATSRKILLETVKASHNAVVITPEMLLFDPAQYLPNSFWNEVGEALRKSHSYLLLGIPYLHRADEETLIYNSVLSIGPSGRDIYLKQRLVPFGEYLPWKQTFSWFYENVLKYPMQDGSVGPEEYGRPLFAGGYMFAPSICYETAYSAQVARGAVKANILANLANDAWLENDLYLAQGLQMAQARAVETQRPLLKANNMGFTAVISERGNVIEQLPRSRAGILSRQIQGRKGNTPYMILDDRLALGLSILALITSIFFRRGRAK